MRRESFVDDFNYPTQKNESKMTVGQRIKVLRNRLGLTQEELAEKMHVKKSAISKYENGLLDIKLDTLKNLCVALNTTPNYLMGYKDDYSEIAEAYNKINSLEAKRIIMAQVKMVAAENY